LRPVDGHREPDDLRAALTLVDPPAAADAAGDGGGDLPVELGVAVAPLDQRSG
jgi:hypothetical protein